MLFDPADEDLPVVGTIGNAYLRGLARFSFATRQYGMAAVRRLFEVSRKLVERR